MSLTLVAQVPVMVEVSPKLLRKGERVTDTEEGLSKTQQRELQNVQKGNLRVDTGQDLSVVGLDVLDNNITPGGLGANRLLLAVSTASVELAEVLKIEKVCSAGNSQTNEKKRT